MGMVEPSRRVMSEAAGKQADTGADRPWFGWFCAEPEPESPLKILPPEEEPGGVGCVDCSGAVGAGVSGSSDSTGSSVACGVSDCGGAPLEGGDGDADHWPRSVGSSVAVGLVGSEAGPLLKPGWPATMRALKRQACIGFAEKVRMRYFIAEDRWTFPIVSSEDGWIHR